MRKIQDGCRVVLVCGHDYVGRGSRVQRVESERRHGRHGSRQFGDYRCGIGRIGLRVQSYSLNIMYIPGSEELVIFICAFVGALVGFLWYNAYPAQIFMGDTGSLSIGGIIAVTAIIIHKELLIPLMCFVFLMESLSVILQVNYAKWGNRKGLKLRVFKRAPIHDTFRVRPGQLAPDVKVLCNWPKGCWLESKVTVRFWIITIILAAMTIITLKIR